MERDNKHRADNCDSNIISIRILHRLRKRIPSVEILVKKFRLWKKFFL